MESQDQGRASCSEEGALPVLLLMIVVMALGQIRRGAWTERYRQEAGDRARVCLQNYGNALTAA